MLDEILLQLSVSSLGTDSAVEVQTGSCCWVGRVVGAGGGLPEACELSLPCTL